MTSELDLFLVGVEFVRGDNGRFATVTGPPGTSVVGAIAERMDVVRTYLRTGERATVRGICDACARPMGLLCRCVYCQKRSPEDRWKKHGSSSNRSGICWPCERALEKIMAAGEWPPKHVDGPTAVRDVEALIAALPPKPKAPWEET